MRYLRAPLEVEATLYELNKGMEDGFELWTDIITRSCINNQKLIRVTRENGSIVCPYIENRRGRSYIQDGDYIITEMDGNRHVCNGSSFPNRFTPIESTNS